MMVSQITRIIKKIAKEPSWSLEKLTAAEKDILYEAGLIYDEYTRNDKGDRVLEPDLTPAGSAMVQFAVREARLKNKLKGCEDNWQDFMERNERLQHLIE